MEVVKNGITFCFLFLLSFVGKIQFLRQHVVARDTRMTYRCCYMSGHIIWNFGEFKISFEMSASLRVVLSYDFKRRIVDIYMYS